MRDKLPSIHMITDRAPGVLRASAGLAVLLVFVQAFLAGHLLTGNAIAREWHGAVGTELFLAVAAVQVVAALVTAYATRAATSALLALSMFGLITLQSSLGWDGRLALHVPNALLILAGQSWLFLRSRRHATTNGPEGTQDELLGMEAAFWGAAGDGEFYEQHFADDGTCVFGFGVLDKQQTVAAIEAARPWTSFEMHDVSASTLRRDTVALVYRASATRDDDTYEAMVSSVYVKQDDDWWLALHQQTPAG